MDVNHELKLLLECKEKKLGSGRGGGGWQGGARVGCWVFGFWGCQPRIEVIVKMQ